MWLRKGKYFLTESLQFLGFLNYALISVANASTGHESVVPDGARSLATASDNVHKEGDENRK